MRRSSAPECSIPLLYERVAGEWSFIEALRHLLFATDALAGSTVPVSGPGWPPSQSFPVREVLMTIVNEEWWHRQFAERDLATLTGNS